MAKETLQQTVTEVTEENVRLKSRVEELEAKVRVQMEGREIEGGREGREWTVRVGGWERKGGKEGLALDHMQRIAARAK